MTTEACCTPAPPATETSQGREDTLGGLRVYLSGSASATAAVILIPDIFGTYFILSGFEPQVCNYRMHPLTVFKHTKVILVKFRVSFSKGFRVHKLPSLASGRHDNKRW